VREWDAQTGGEMRQFPGRSDVRSVAYSPDGRWCAIGNWNGEIELRDIHGETSRVWSGHTHAIRGLAFSPDAKFLVSASAEGTIFLWNLSP
jgi:WD40 repeat protein